MRRDGHGRQLRSPHPEEAAQRPSRRMAASSASGAILRDACLRQAPQDEGGTMTTVGTMASRGFWLRTRAMLIKEFIQLKRDRLSFGMIIMIPLMQLVLFGYAINTTPRDLPTAVLLQEKSDVGRSILAALMNTRYFKVTLIVHCAPEFYRLM